MSRCTSNEASPGASGCMAEASGTESRAKTGQTPSGQITVRPMTETDLAEVAALEAETFAMPWSAHGFAEALGRRDTVFLVAHRDVLIGYAGAYCTLDEGGITNVAVAACARRCGVARRLLQELAERLSARGIRRIFLEVRVSNTPAIRLYESCGFRIAGTRRRFYERPVEDAYVMCREAGLEGEPAVPYGEAGASSLQ